MTEHEHNHIGGSPWTAAREQWLLVTLAAIQFTTVLDFLIIIPLEPQYTQDFHISPKEFSWIVAAYGIAAGIMGIAAGFFLDRFDRKKALIWLYSGFAVGTLFCGMAPTFQLLLWARFVAGGFGGVCGAVILAIVGDVIPMERRGAAMGKVMTSFSISNIVGVPAGLYIAEYSNWHVPFYFLAGLSAVIVIVAAVITPPLREHMRHAVDEHPFARTWAVMTHPDHQRAFLLMGVLTFAGFCIFPYLPGYMERNVGMSEKQLPLVYICGGVCTVFSMNWIGRWSDRAGKLRVFTIMSLSVAAPILLLTNLPRVPLVAALAVTTLLMICMSGRMVPAMAMITGSVAARYRGGFMSINSAVQMFSLGLASYVSGWVIGETPDHSKLTHYPVAGLMAIGCAYLCIYLARFLRIPEGEEEEEPAVVEAM